MLNIFLFIRNVNYLNINFVIFVIYSHVYLYIHVNLHATHTVYYVNTDINLMI